jgi:single-strand DNA-binding protein
MNIKFSGNVGKEPEMRYTPAGKPITTFSVALYTGGTKDKGYNEPVWVRVSAWEALAETVNNTIKKGMKVTVSGQPQSPRTYENKTTGETRSAGLEVTAYEVVEGDALNQDQLDNKDEYSEEIPF